MVGTNSEDVTVHKSKQVQKHVEAVGRILHSERHTVMMLLILYGDFFD